MKNRPKISVVMSCYNNEEYVAEAIDSVLSQTYKDFELVLIDDGSTDNSLRILKKYAYSDKRINLIEKNHSGLTSSLNIGLHQAIGEWVARLDSDDLALPDRLEQQLSYCEKNRDVVVLGGGCIEIDEMGNSIRTDIYPSKHDKLMKRLRDGKGCFAHVSAFYSRSFVLALDGYNERFLMGQDQDLFLRIGERTTLNCLEVPVVKARVHSHSIRTIERGRRQYLYGICATICYFRRMKGLSDPSQMHEDVWKGFMRWVEIQLEKSDVFRQTERWRKLRAAWYHNQFLRNKIKGLISQQIKDPMSCKAIWRYIWEYNHAIKIAEESSTLF